MRLNCQARARQTTVVRRDRMSKPPRRWPAWPCSRQQSAHNNASTRNSSMPSTPKSSIQHTPQRASTPYCITDTAVCWVSQTTFTRSVDLDQLAAAEGLSTVWTGTGVQGLKPSCQSAPHYRPPLCSRPLRPVAEQANIKGLGFTARLPVPGCCGVVTL